MEIRRVADTDASQIASIYNNYILRSTASFETEPLSEQQMRERIIEIAGTKESPMHPYLVAVEGSTILGYCYAHPWKERAAYNRTLETSIYLRPEAKGMGLGSALMERLIQECIKQGYHALIACITAENTASIAFHQKLGFKMVSQFDEVGHKFGSWLGVVDMELILSR